MEREQARMEREQPRMEREWMRTEREWMRMDAVGSTPAWAPCIVMDVAGMPATG
jgi:hypothetical protein